MLSCTAAILHGNFPRRGLNSPRHCTSTQGRNQASAQGDIKSSSEYSEPTAPGAESTNLCGPQWVLERDVGPFCICIGLWDEGGSQNFKS